MSPEEVFYHRYNKLSQIVTSRSQADLLDLALIMRQLIVDSSPLVDIVNRKYHLRIKYRAHTDFVEFNKELGPATTLSVVADIPGNELVSKDRYLSSKIMLTSGQYYSVRDVIDICANRLGGVHYSSPERDNREEAKARYVNNSFSFMGAPSLFYLLFANAKVVHEALRELYQAVKKDFGMQD